MILHKPWKIWWLDSDNYKEFNEVLLSVKFWRINDILVCVDDNDPVCFHMTRDHFEHKYFKKFLLEKFGEIK